MEQTNQKIKKAAGVLVYNVIYEEFLLGQRGEKCSFPGTWGCFGGMVEEGDEDVVQAAARELGEETGFVGQMLFMYLGNQTSSDLCYFTFLGITDDDFTIEPPEEFEDEMQDYAWFSPYEMMTCDNLHPNFKEFLHENAAKILDIITKKEEDVQ